MQITDINGIVLRVGDLVRHGKYIYNNTPCQTYRVGMIVAIGEESVSVDWLPCTEMKKDIIARSCDVTDQSHICIHGDRNVTYRPSLYANSSGRNSGTVILTKIVKDND